MLKQRSGDVPLHDDNVPPARWPYPFLLQVHVSTTVAYAALSLSGAAVGLIVGTSQVQLSATQAQLSKGGASIHLLGNGWFVAGLLLAALGVLLGLLAIAVTNVQSRARRRSPLRIVFNEVDPLCVTHDDKKIAVRVRNMGHIGLQDVRLKVVGRMPQGALHPLRLQHDTSPFERSLAGDSCSPGEFLYFDVAELRNNTVGIMYASDNLAARAVFPQEGEGSGPWLTLKAEGRREDEGLLVPPAHATFKVYLTGHEWLRLKRLG